MAKLNNPLFGFSARGTLAKALTFRRRGRQVIAESKPIPKDAKTSSQLAWRTMYQLCTDLWHTLSAAEKQTWETQARRQHMTGYNYYMSLCLRPNPGIYLPLAGGTMSGNIDMDTNRILNLPSPSANEEPSRKIELDTHTADKDAHHSNIIDITFIIDGGGSAITTGEKGHLRIPFACTISQVTLLADQAGSIVIDIWKDTYANFPPTNADSITASAPPTLSAAQKSQDSTLTGWTKSISAGDILAFNVDSCATIERVTISLKVTKT